MIAAALTIAMLPWMLGAMLACFACLNVLRAPASEVGVIYQVTKDPAGVVIAIHYRAVRLDCTIPSDACWVHREPFGALGSAVDAARGAELRHRRAVLGKVYACSTPNPLAV